MSLTTSALQIGRSALLSYQAALQVVGNNIANAGNPAYTRQSADLSSLAPPFGTTIPIGNGVALSAVKRNVSEAIETRLRQARSDQASTQAEDSALSRLESILNALGDSNLSTTMEKFFKSFGDLQNNPESIASRRIVLANGDQLAQTMHQMRSDLLAARDEANNDITSATGQANQLASQIAQLNVQIVTAEAGTDSPAGAL